MMDEMGRLGAMWEETWHVTLADLQVCETSNIRLYYRSSAHQRMLDLPCKVHMQSWHLMSWSSGTGLR